MSRRKQARPIRVCESEEGLESKEVLVLNGYEEGHHHPGQERRINLADNLSSTQERIQGEESGSDLEEDEIGGVTREETMCEDCTGLFPSAQEAEEHRRVCSARIKDSEDDGVADEEENLSLPEEGKRLEVARRQKQDFENNNNRVEAGQVDEDNDDDTSVGCPLGHVTLEALQNTKVAVAQFAATAMANNPENAAALQELAVLQSTLYTLQHQQIMQLNLIQQLQQQLQINRPSSPSITPIPRNIPTPTPLPTLPSPPTPASQPLPASGPPTPTSTAIATSVPKPMTPPPVVLPPVSSLPPCSVSSAFASSIINNLDPPPSPSEPNTLEMLQRRAQEVLDNASQGLLANNLADELAFRKSGGKSLSPYDSKTGGRNEPFFKHRCRYCGKVFGSDSALQIHIRSHTGERPFKCNVCGSRFTTKGNLKVHFQRHTSKFPHIKMNPNPIPEHLDKYHPPLLAQIGAHQNLPSGHLPHQTPPPHHQYHPSPTFPPTALPLYRPQHDLVMSPSHQALVKPNLSLPLFGQRVDSQQTLPQNLTKLVLSQTHSSSPPPSDHTDHFKKEPSEEEGPLPLTVGCSESTEPIKHEERLSPKTEPERYSPVQYDDCSMDSKYSQEQEELPGSSPGLDDLHQDQPENLSNKMRGNTTCNICFKTFACNSALEIHYRSHTKERPFKCTICDRGFSTKGNMKQHMLTHKIRDMPSHLFEQKSPHDESSNTSSESRDLTLPRALETPQHPGFQVPAEGLPVLPALPHQPQQPHIPKDQPHPLASPRLIGHPQPIKRSPPEEAMLPIPKRQPSLPKHLCHVCNKNFSSSSALQIHMRTHTGDKPFQCTICRKAFTTKGNLKVHMGTHMWTNGASRRGRRMSLELPPLGITPKDSDLLHRRPDIFYPYLPAPFLNGMQQKLNEISVIQNVGSNISNGMLGFGGYGGSMPSEMKPGSPMSDKQPTMSPRHRATPPLWDLHCERKGPAAEDQMDCQSPPGHVPPRGEGLAA